MKYSIQEEDTIPGTVNLEQRSEGGGEATMCVSQGEFSRSNVMEICQIPIYLETLKPSGQAMNLTEEIKVKIEKYIELSHSENAPDQNVWVPIK